MLNIISSVTCLSLIIIDMHTIMSLHNVSRIYGSSTRTYLLMRKQYLMLLLAASEHAEKDPLDIKFRKDIVESYKPIVWAEPRPISMLQNISHLSNNHLFLRHMLLCGLGVYT